MNAVGLALCIGIAWGAVVGILFGIVITPRNRAPRDRLHERRIEAAAIAKGIIIAHLDTLRRQAGACRVCGCTDDDCRQCIERTGAPCHWVKHDLCSACESGLPEANCDA